jgi:hypothetical protein
MLAHCRRAVSAALLLSLATAAARPVHAAPVAVLRGMTVQMTGFTPQQEQVIRNGIALFDNMAAPTLAFPATLPVSAVPGTTSTTTATWRGTQLVGVAIAFGVDRLGVGQTVHELIHVAQLANPAWADQERAFAAAHPYPAVGFGAWLDLPTVAPAAPELCPRVIESLLEGGPMAAYVGQQPEDVRWCLNHLAGG